MDFKPRIQKIETAIKNNRLKNALEDLYAVLQELGATEEKNQVLLQLSNLRNLDDDERDSTITSEVLLVHRGRIVKATLGLLTSAEQIILGQNEVARNVEEVEWMKPADNIFKSFLEKFDEANLQPMDNTASQPSALLYDDFRDNILKWYVGSVSPNQPNSVPIGTLNIINQQYVFNIPVDGFIYGWRPVNIILTQSFSIETQVRFYTGDNKGYGIVWGADSATFDCYYFLISHNGYFCIGYQINNNQQILANWHYSAYIYQGNNTNTLRLERKGENVLFYINGQHIFSSIYYKFFGQHAGMMAGGHKQVGFDYFKVEQ